MVRTYDYAIAVLTWFSATNLFDTVEFFAEPMSKLQIINLLSDHQAHQQRSVACLFKDLWFDTFKVYWLVMQTFLADKD